MDIVWILLLGLLIGAVLGGLGGGGAILTVPALVYVVGQRAQDATTSSLVIVGLTAAVGVLSYLSAQRVRWGMGLTFGAVGLPATWLGSFLNHRVDENVLLLGFSVLMVIAAAAMVADQSKAKRSEDHSTRFKARTPSDQDAHQESSGAVEPRPGRSAAATSLLDRDRTSEGAAQRTSVVAVVMVALGVGLLTGFFGVGGGFVIVPALVLVLRLPMHQAVGTSLMIVALNSATSLASRITTAHFDWAVIIPFTLAAMVATLVGKRVADRLPARKLKLGFATLLVLVAGYTAWQSIDGLTQADSSTPASGRFSSTQSSTDILQPAQARAAVATGARLVDVRTPEEFASGHLAGALNIDLSSPTFDREIAILDPRNTYVVYCASGNRSTTAVERMADLGFDTLLNGGGYGDLTAELRSAS